MDDPALTIKIFIGTILVGAILLAAAASGSCQGSTDRQRKLLEDHGYSEIQMTGYAPLACGEGDISSSGFRAKSPSGTSVSGSVCCGAFKGCTIRFR